MNPISKPDYMPIPELRKMQAHPFTDRNFVIQTDKYTVFILPECRLDEVILHIVPLLEVIVNQSACI